MGNLIKPSIFIHCVDNSELLELNLSREKILSSPNFPLGLSHDYALKTLLAMENKFSRDPVFKKKYCEFMQIYEEIGEMSKGIELSDQEKANCYFLPHCGISQGSKKLRTVFIGFVKIRGVSLNDLLYSGPSLVPELFDLFMSVFFDS